jgi:hypothetical protein
MTARAGSGHPVGNLPGEMTSLSVAEVRPPSRCGKSGDVPFPDEVVGVEQPPCVRGSRTMRGSGLVNQLVLCSCSGSAVRSSCTVRARAAAASRAGGSDLIDMAS